MSQRVPWLKSLPLMAALLLIMSCGSKNLAPESLLDTPETHVEQALRLLDKQDLAAASDELNRALALDPKYYRAHSVRALLLLEQGKSSEALKAIDSAVDLADNRWESWLIKGQVLAAAQPGDWKKKADKAMRKASELGAPADEHAFREGQLNMAKFEFQAAVASFSKAVAGRSSWAGPADKEMERCNLILRARPGSRVSKKVALEKELDRADMAVLLVEELKLPEIMAKAKKPARRNFSAPSAAGPGVQAPQATDIDSHWAKTWIQDVLDAGSMSLGPTSRFEPEEILSRAEFSLIVVDILVAYSGDQSLATRHFGETSVFPDMQSSHPAYSAAALCASRGILQAELASGAFRPEGPISGARALLSIRQFQNLLRQEF